MKHNIFAEEIRQSKGCIYKEEPKMDMEKVLFEEMVAALEKRNELEL